MSLPLTHPPKSAQMLVADYANCGFVQCPHKAGDLLSQRGANHIECVLHGTTDAARFRQRSSGRGVSVVRLPNPKAGRGTPRIALFYSSVPWFVSRPTHVMVDEINA
jgi:hypothetical protein